jgi:hypothetical protein
LKHLNMLIIDIKYQNVMQSNIKLTSFLYLKKYIKNCDLIRL